MSVNKKRKEFIARTSDQPETAGIALRVSDLERLLTDEKDTPHLLLAGSTGCGKSDKIIFPGLRFLNGDGHGMFPEVKGNLRNTFKSMAKRDCREIRNWNTSFIRRK